MQQASDDGVKTKGEFKRDVCECYLYVGDNVCGEECVAELGNRSGLPNTH